MIVKEYIFVYNQSMKQAEIHLKNLTGKDETIASEAAEYLINYADEDLFEELVKKSDYLFDFVRNNVNKRIKNAVTSKNFTNIIRFFNVYSPYYDDLFANILSEHATQDLTDDIFELLENGTDAQKTYAAKYFTYIPDTVALELLRKYAFSDDEYLSCNSAEALGEMQDDISFNSALGYLTSDDDFERLKAVKFFAAYGINHPLKEIFDSLKSSKLKENISGQIPYISNLIRLLQTEYKDDTLTVILYIISGLGEILPLSDIFQAELYEVLRQLININGSKNSGSGKISVILLAALAKFNTFNEEQEYTFDETKETKNEISDIYNLLNGQNEKFWEKQKKYLIEELKEENDFSTAAFELIQEFKIEEAQEELKKLLNSDNETVICQAAVSLKIIDKINDADINSVLSKIKNENIKAIIGSL